MIRGQVGPLHLHRDRRRLLQSLQRPCAIDAARRDGILARCVTDGVSFRDLHAEGAGRGWLSGWIGGCQSMFPGTRIVRDGPVLHTRGSLLARWRCEAGGAVVARGVNHGRLSDDGRLAAVEGFWEGP